MCGLIQIMYQWRSQRLLLTVTRCVRLLPWQSTMTLNVIIWLQNTPRNKLKNPWMVSTSYWEPATLKVIGHQNNYPRCFLARLIIHSVYSLTWMKRPKCPMQIMEVHTMILHIMEHIKTKRHLMEQLTIKLHSMQAHTMEVQTWKVQTRKVHTMVVIQIKLL